MLKMSQNTIHTSNTLPIPGIANSSEFTTTLEKTVEGLKQFMRPFSFVYLLPFFRSRNAIDNNNSNNNNNNLHPKLN